MTRQMRELCNCYKENCTRINEIADACEKEQRERTEAENAEYEKLARENSIIQMRMQALSVPSGNGVEKSATVELRECMEAKKTAKIEYRYYPCSRARDAKAFACWSYLG